MHISSIHIMNFRSCEDTLLMLSPFTPIIGYNNAGKSNVLRAVKWLLRPEALSLASDFKDHKQNVVVSVKIEGITSGNLDAVAEEHRAKMAPLVVNESLCLQRVQDCTKSGKAAVRLYVAAGDAKDLRSCAWKANPAGLDVAIQELFPEPIFIEAMTDAASDVTKNSKTSTIGLLVAEITEEIKKQHQDTIDRALKGVRELLDMDGANRPMELRDLDAAASAALAAIFPGIDLRVHVPTPVLDDIFKGATIKVVEHGLRRDVSSLGHGAQRSIQFALIQVLANIAGKVNKSTNTLLLIEEPEAYLHPHAIELIRLALQKLSVRGYQVIAVTHSPQFVGMKEVPSAVLLRKDAKRGTYSMGTIKAEVEKAFTDHAAQREVLFSLTNANQILFADSVLLYEGPTEQRLVPAIYEALHKSHPMADKVAMVHVGGCGGLKNAKTILDALGMRTRALCDLDFACKQAVSLGLVQGTHKSIAHIKSAFGVLYAAGKAKAGTDGWPVNKVDPGQMPAAVAFAAVALDPSNGQAVEQLRDDMKKLGYWVWPGGDIEEHLGIDRGKDPDAHNELAEKIVNDLPTSGVKDLATVGKMAHWMAWK